MGSHFGVSAPPILAYFSRDWDDHWGYGILTHGHMLASHKNSGVKRLSTPKLALRVALAWRNSHNGTGTVGHDSEPERLEADFRQHLSLQHLPLSHFKFGPSIF